MDDPLLVARLDADSTLGVVDLVEAKEGEGNQGIQPWVTSSKVGDGKPGWSRS